MNSVGNLFVSALSQRWRLTARESDILSEIVSGHITSKDLAAALSLSTSTAEKHLESISKKSKLSGRSELTSYLLSTFSDFLNSLGSSSLSQERARVGVVDDDRDAADAIALSLSDFGLEAYALPCDDPEIHSPKLAPEVLICDYILGPINGLHLAQSIRRSGLGAPSIILITGYPEEFDKEEPGEVVMMKPLDIESLVKATWSAVTVAQLRRRLLRQLTAAS